MCCASSTYTNREFTGEEAARLGFATRLSDDPHADAMALAHEIADRNPHAVRGAKRLYNLAADGDARHRSLPKAPNRRGSSAHPTRSRR